MLKLKENVKLKELEKFGFEKIDDIYRYSSEQPKESLYRSVIYLYDYKRIINIDKCKNKNDLDILYDLIQANLIEKV